MAKKFLRADNWCEVNQQTIKTSFVWKINKFSKCNEKTGEDLVTTTFSAKEDKNTVWSLQLFPVGITKEDKEYISLYLHMKSSDRNEVKTDFKLSLINEEQDITQTRKAVYSFSKIMCGSGYGWAKFAPRSLLEDSKNGLLPKDVLTIYCEVSYLSQRKITGGTTPTAYYKSKRSLLEDMTQLYKNLNNCDIDIIVKGRKFSAHKAILSARSQVFAAMFEHQMTENLQNKVIIKDIDKKVFEKVLRFIYTDQVVKEDMDSNIKLFCAADKYNLENLKSICVEYIGSQLTVESVSNVLILADTHSAEELKLKALSFIKSNFDGVAKTKGWMKII